MSLYQNPRFVNNQAPALNAANMNALADTVEASQTYELNFNITTDIYATASSTNKANYTNYWDNQNIVATPKQNAHSFTVDKAKFKDKVGDIEGTYTFTYNTSTTKWAIDGVDISDSTFTAIPSYGISGLTNPVSVAAERTATVTLTFDGYKEQKITINGVTTKLIGSIGVSSSATKAQFDAAAYAQFRCIEQGDGYVVIVCYGVIPDITIPCVIEVTGSGNIKY